VLVLISLKNLFFTAFIYVFVSTAVEKNHIGLFINCPNYHLKSEVSIMLCCQLDSTHYTAVQINSKSTSVIEVATMENTGDFCDAKEAITCYHQINTFCCQQK